MAKSITSVNIVVFRAINVRRSSLLLAVCQDLTVVNTLEPIVNIRLAIAADRSIARAIIMDVLSGINQSLVVAVKMRLAVAAE